MAAKTSWFRRVLFRFGAWLRQNMGDEGRALERQESNWDYAQADLQPWNDEPDDDRLSAALKLHSTDRESAFSPLYLLATEGSPLAMNCVGEDYYWGRGVPADRVSAERWFKKAFERGSRRGLLNYGLLLFRTNRYFEAETVFNEAAADDWPPALYWLARIEGRRSLFRSRKRIRALLESATAAGSPAAASTLAILMAVGLYGPMQMPQGYRLLQEYWRAGLARAKAVRRSTPSGDTLH